jgi:hypothetical protein
MTFCSVWFLGKKRPSSGATNPMGRLSYQMLSPVPLRFPNSEKF